MLIYKMYFFKKIKSYYLKELKKMRIEKETAMHNKKTMENVLMQMNNGNPSDFQSLKNKYFQ